MGNSNSLIIRSIGDQDQNEERENELFPENTCFGKNAILLGPFDAGKSYLARKIVRRCNIELGTNEISHGRGIRTKAVNVYGGSNEVTFPSGNNYHISIMDSEGLMHTNQAENPKDEMHSAAIAVISTIPSLVIYVTQLYNSIDEIHIKAICSMLHRNSQMVVLHNNIPLVSSIPGIQADLQSNQTLKVVKDSSNSTITIENGLTIRHLFMTQYMHAQGNLKYNSNVEKQLLNMLEYSIPSVDLLSKFSEAKLVEATLKEDPIYRYHFVTSIGEIQIYFRNLLETELEEWTERLTVPEISDNESQFKMLKTISADELHSIRVIQIHGPISLDNINFSHILNHTFRNRFIKLTVEGCWNNPNISRLEEIELWTPVTVKEPIAIKPSRFCSLLYVTVLLPALIEV